MSYLAILSSNISLCKLSKHVAIGTIDFASKYSTLINPARGLDLERVAAKILLMHLSAQGDQNLAGSYLESLSKSKRPFHGDLLVILNDQEPMHPLILNEGLFAGTSWYNELVIGLLFFARKQECHSAQPTPGNLITDSKRCIFLLFSLVSEARH